MMHAQWTILNIFKPKMCFHDDFYVIRKIESNIHAPVLNNLLNVLNSLRKSDKMWGKPNILLLFPNLFNTCVYSIKDEHSSKIVYTVKPL